MLKTVCQSCHDHLRLRLRRKILAFQQLRCASTGEHASDLDISASNRTTPKRSPLVSVLSHLRVFPPPSETQQSHAQQFFARYKPKPLWVSDQWRKSPDSQIPEVAFVGRSNVGKSSLINSITASEICYTGPRPGKTREMRAYGLTGAKADGGAGKGGTTGFKIALLDTPGYGPSSIKELGGKITKYLGRRKQLRRVFVMINPEHGAKKHDYSMLRMLREIGVPYQIIFTKVDRLKKPASGELGILTSSPNSSPWSGIPAAINLLREAFQGRLDAAGLETGQLDVGHGNMLLSGRPAKDNDQFWQRQLDEIRWAIMQATGFDSDVGATTEKHTMRSSPTIQDQIGVTASDEANSEPTLLGSLASDDDTLEPASLESHVEPIPSSNNTSDTETPGPTSSKSHASDKETPKPTPSESQAAPSQSSSIEPKGSRGRIGEELLTRKSAEASKIFDNAIASLNEVRKLENEGRKRANSGRSSQSDAHSHMTSVPSSQTDDPVPSSAPSTRLSSVDALLSIPKSTNRSRSKNEKGIESSSVDNSLPPQASPSEPIAQKNPTTSSNSSYKQVGGLSELEDLVSQFPPFSSSARSAGMGRDGKRSRLNTQIPPPRMAVSERRRLRRLTGAFEEKQMMRSKGQEKNSTAKEPLTRTTSMNSMSRGRR